MDVLPKFKIEIIHGELKSDATKLGVLVNLEIPASFQSQETLESLITTKIKILSESLLEKAIPFSFELNEIEGIASALILYATLTVLRARFLARLRPENNNSGNGKNED